MKHFVAQITLSETELKKLKSLTFNAETVAHMRGFEDMILGATTFIRDVIVLLEDVPRPEGNADLRNPARVAVVGTHIEGIET